MDMMSRGEFPTALDVEAVDMVRWANRIREAK